MMNDLLGKVSTTGMGHIETIVVWIHAGYMPIFKCEMTPASTQF